MDGDIDRHLAHGIHLENSKDMPTPGLQVPAIRHFDFLILEMGYKRTLLTPDLVRFESARVFVELVYDGNRSFELALLVGKLGSPTPPYTLGEILRLRRAPESSSFALVQVTTVEGLTLWLEELANALRTFASDFITGNEKSFIEIEELREKEVQNYANERDLKVARSEAEAAWHNKDYGRVVKILRPLRAALTKADISKLEYAAKQRGKR